MKEKDKNPLLNNPTLDRSVPPVSAPFKEGHEILQATTKYLDNGIPLHLVLSGSQPLIRFEMVFDAGIWHESINNTSYLTAKMVSAGTKKYTSEQIEKLIAYYGAFIDLENGPDRSIITIYSLSKYLEPLLPLITDILNASIFPEEEFKNIKNIALQNIKLNLAKTSYLASSAFRKRVFGEKHPYGKSLQEEAIVNIRQEDIKNFYENFFTSNNCELIISGNGDIDFHQLLNRYFGKSFLRKGSSTKQNYKVECETGRLNIPKEDNLQSSIRIGRPLFTLNHPDYFETFIFTEVLGGYFGSRLMKNIREDKGFTYGIHANVICHKHQGYFVIGTDVNKDNAEQTITEIYKEINILKNEPVNDNELTTVKNYMLGSFYNSINTPFALADKFKMVHFNSLDYSFFTGYIDAIQHIESRRIMEIATRYFNENEMVEIVAGSK